MKMIKYLCFLMFAALLATGFAARAELGALKISSSEEIVMLFYKLSGGTPNFDKWITEREPYKTTPLTMRDETFAQEMKKLRDAWEKVNPQKDQIVIKTDVVARV